MARSTRPARRPLSLADTRSPNTWEAPRKATHAQREGLPFLLTVPEVADLLRTTTKGVYAMVERALLPGVIRIGRRVLIRSGVLVDWLRQKSASSPKE